MLVYGVDKKNTHENGARTLGVLAEKYLLEVVNEYYPNGTFITFGAYEEKGITQGQVVIMWHLNTPTETAIEYWQKTNKLYPNAIYLVNSPQLHKELSKIYDRVYYLPRFIDPEELPTPKTDKKNDVLWFGNVWKHHKDKYTEYMNSNRFNYWISKNVYSMGTTSNHNIVNRKQALDIVNNSKKVWAIGLCAMEAKHLGCEVYAYDGKDYDVIYPEYAIKELRKILDREVQQKTHKD